MEKLFRYLCVFMTIIIFLSSIGIIFASALSKEKEQLFLKKLRIIENEIRVKQIKIKQKAINLEQQEEKSHSRGR